MAIKHFKEQFNIVTQQYKEMEDGLIELQELAITNSIDPDTIENYKQTLAPIREAFLLYCQVDYLLKLPARKKKTKKFRNSEMDKACLSTIDKCKNINKELDKVRENVR